MYRVSPFTYLVSALLSTGVANAPITCSSIEYLNFDPPSGQTCMEYMSTYMNTTGQGSFLNPDATSGCKFCSLSDTNAFLAQIDIHYSNRWRDFGIVMVFVILSALGAVGLYWLARVPKNKKNSQTK